MNNDRIHHAWRNLEQALTSLEEFLAEPIRTNRDRAGVIQAFEFTYELAWKIFQKIAQEEGLHAGTPRQAFASALQAGLIHPEEEATWVGMIRDRNLTSHTYNEGLAREIVQRVHTSYFPLLKATVARIEDQFTR